MEEKHVHDLIELIGLNAGELVEDTQLTSDLTKILYNKVDFKNVVTFFVPSSKVTSAFTGFDFQDFKVSNTRITSKIREDEGTSENLRIIQKLLSDQDKKLKATYMTTYKHLKGPSTKQDYWVISITFE